MKSFNLVVENEQNLHNHSVVTSGPIRVLPMLSPRIESFRGGETDVEQFDSIT
jgi:hypothetical protein